MATSRDLGLTTLTAGVTLRWKRKISKTSKAFAARIDAIASGKQLLLQRRFEDIAIFVLLSDLPEEMNKKAMLSQR